MRFNYRMTDIGDLDCDTDEEFICWINNDSKFYTGLTSKFTNSFCYLDDVKVSLDVSMLKTITSLVLL